MSLLLLVGVLLLFVLGAPLFVCLGALALGLLLLAGLDPQSIGIEMYRLASSPNLVVIPLFAFAGVIMARSGLPRRFVAVARALFGWLPGAEALVALLTFEAFTAFTGASGISILAVGGMLYSVLRRAGYSDRFSLGLISASGSLGVLLPPSIVIIFYGTLTRTPIELLFKAGLLPGLVMVAVLGVYCAWVGRHRVGKAPFSLLALRKAVWDARFELPLPPLVVVASFSGVLTVAEAACLTALALLVVEVFLYKDLSLRRDLPAIGMEAMTLVGAILVVLGTALGVTNYLIYQGIPDQLLLVATEHIHSKVAFLIFLNVLLLVTGCLLDVFSALILLTPLLTPLAVQFGVDPVHLGIIFLANLEIGYSTPPVGLNLFVAALTFRRPAAELVRAVVPFVLLLLLAVLIITFVPWLSTWPVPSLSLDPLM